MSGLTIAFLIAVSAPPVEVVPPPPRRIARIIERADGTSAETAFRVRSVRQEYQVVQALGLQTRSQSLIFVGRRPFDVLTVTDPRSGEERRLWFDISSFYGSGF